MLLRFVVKMKALIHRRKVIYDRTFTWSSKSQLTFWFSFFIGTYSWQAELREIRDCRKINDILERRSTEIRKLYEECQDSCKFHFQILLFCKSVLGIQIQALVIMHASCYYACMLIREMTFLWKFPHIFTFHTFTCTVFYVAFLLLFAARVSFIFLTTRSTRHLTLPSFSDGCEE